MKQLGRCPMCGKPITLLNVGLAVLKWGGKVAALVGAAQGRPVRAPVDHQWMRRCALCQQMR